MEDLFIFKSFQNFVLCTLYLYWIKLYILVKISNIWVDCSYHTVPNSHNYDDDDD